jgi:hypothetical protein
MRIYKDGGGHPRSYIHCKEVADFNNGIQNLEVAQLSTMMNKVKDGSNFILAVCAIITYLLLDHCSV